MYLTDFVRDEESQVFLPFDEKQKDFAYSDGAENYLLNILTDADNLTDCSEQLQRKIKDWPTRYHLGQGRSNIFRALEIGGKKKVLELGSGCGALSRYLGQSCEAVDCVEGSYIRAQTGRQRCRDLRNVRVFCSNILNVTFEAVYDIVTLVGVWEYAPAYIDRSQDPVYTLLKLAKSALKDDGTVIIAIENKIGLKYWSGSPEDHTGKIYDGIHGYPAKRIPRKSAATFSKREIEKHLRSVGFEYIHFYYCFPDYKFATTIFSDLGNDDQLYLHNWIDVPFECPDAEHEYNIHEGLALRTLSRAGLLREFANSFLVAASKNNTSALLKPDWIGKKISGYPRRKKYQCITTLKKGRELYIEKKKLNAELENTDIGTTSDGQLLKHSVINSRWHSGELLLYDVYEAVFSKNFKNSLVELLKQYYEELIKRFYTDENDAQGYPLLRGDCFDFLLKNIIKRDDEFIFIDAEWCAVKELTGDYLMYRCIKHDIIKSHCPRIKAAVGRGRNFTISVIKAFFPQYGRKRYKQNKQLDKMLLNPLTES